jgi:spoIIIJ-associated protein
VDDEERVPSYGAQKEDPVGEMTLQEQGDAARIFVEGLVDRLGLRASVAIRTTAEDTVSVDVDGEGLGTLVGPGGTTLAALQELTRTYVQKITGGQSDRILVDVAGYRAKRVEALQRFTQGVADEVLASGTAKALEPMSAADRKVVHDTVNAIDGVVTRSEGEDPRRYIVLAPVDGGQG